jgi:uncharacterized protein (DUF3084 family)
MPDNELTYPHEYVAALRADNDALRAQITRILDGWEETLTLSRSLHTRLNAVREQRDQLQADLDALRASE